MIHEISDAPPATLAAVSAPSSQPDPIIVPRLIKVSPRSPTARCRCCDPAAVCVWPVGEVFAMVFLQKVLVGNGCRAVHRRCGTQVRCADPGYLPARASQ